VVSHAHDSPELARAYDRVSEQQFEGGQRLVGFLLLARGDRVLDVGCGTGRLAEWMSALVGDAVVGIDPLPERINLARARAPALRFEVGRAEDLSAFPDGSFDVVCASAVFHWVADKPRALSEFARVLRPGGRLGVTTLAKELQLEGSLPGLLRSILIQPPYREHARHMVNVVPAATLTQTIAMLRDARLALRELHVVRRCRPYDTGEDVVSFFEASAFGNLLASVPDHVRPRLRSDLVAAFDARRTSDGILVQDHGALFVADRLG
jgi:arsenite methyltransferase